MADDRKLTPLTVHQAAEFEVRRESDTTIQNKCPRCGAWYETDRKSHDFTEMFSCDCGNFMSFKVPKIVTRALRPTNEQVLGLSDGDALLDSGMRVSEALRRSEAWWEAKGKHEARLQAMRQQEPVGGANRGIGSAFADQDPASENHLPSGVIHGYDWDALTKREKLMITKTWHHFYVRKPDVIGEDASARHKLQERDKIQ